MDAAQNGVAWLVPLPWWSCPSEWSKNPPVTSAGPETSGSGRLRSSSGSARRVRGATGCGTAGCGRRRRQDARAGRSTPIPRSSRGICPPPGACRRPRSPMGLPWDSQPSASFSHRPPRSHRLPSRRSRRRNARPQRPPAGGRGRCCGSPRCRTRATPPAGRRGRRTPSCPTRTWDGAGHAGSPEGRRQRLRSSGVRRSSGSAPRARPSG